ncbi:DUF6089 family protein [bacterium]|nr:DUF6089 family protein [bacterium]
MRNYTLLLLITFLLFAQFSTAQRWKRHRTEYCFGVGFSNFLGDLGGKDGIGTNDFRDFEYTATRIGGLGFGYRYQLSPDFYTKVNLMYSMVSGSDALTSDPSRSARELSFTTDIVELSGQFEYKFIKKKTGHLYRLRGVRGKSWFRFEMYVFAGIGAIWFNPRAQVDGTWHRLSPLNTEGQGLPGGPSDYSNFTLVVPYGIGISRNLTTGRGFNSWSIGLELSMRHTFTDYLDDVSTTYYDEKLIQEAYGDVAAHFSDPSDGTSGVTHHGEQRGDPANRDVFMLAVISVNYKFTKRRRNMPKF